MWLSVAFPTCPKCTNNSHQCYHKNCPNGGRTPMEINSDTSYVRCPSCGMSWHISESNYYCDCDYVFTANEVSDEINAIVYNAKIIANEIIRNAATRDRLRQLTNKEISIKTETIIKKKWGEQLWNHVKYFLPAIIETIKKWLGL